jgi:ABC-type branched-subunit amino acid transport system substrate-binding protein
MCAAVSALVVSALSGCASDSTDQADASSAPSSSGSSELTGTPFKIGFANQDEGAVSFPGATDGFKAAVEYFNTQNGINGHPIEVVECPVDPSPEANQACGNEFANDASLQMVTVGLSQGAGPLYEALTPSGLPTYTVIPLTPADFNAPRGVAYQAGVPGSTYYVEVAKQMDAKKVVGYFLDAASGRATASVIKSQVPADWDYQEVFLPPNFSDPLPYLAQGNATEADAILDILSSACLPLVEAMATLGISPEVHVTSPSCATPDAVKSNESLWQGSKVLLYAEDAPMGEGVSDELDTFLENYPKYADLPQDNGVPSIASNGWAAVAALVEALKDQPDEVLMDHDKLYEALRAFKGPVPMGVETLDCGGHPMGTALCTIEQIATEYDGTKLVPFES